MAGANPTETHHLLQRSTLRQRVVTSCHHEGHHHGDAGTLALIPLFQNSHIFIEILFSPLVSLNKKL